MLLFLHFYIIRFHVCFLSPLSRMNNCTQELKLKDNTCQLKQLSLRKLEKRKNLTKIFLNQDLVRFAHRYLQLLCVVNGQGFKELIIVADSRYIFST